MEQKKIKDYFSRLIKSKLILSILFVLFIFIIINNISKSKNNLNINLSDNKPVPVEVKEAQYYENVKEIITTGATQAEEIVVLKSAAAGTVVEINFSIGSHIKKGDVLAVLDTSTIDAEIALKEEEFKVKEKLLSATKKLLDEGIVSYPEYAKSQIDFLEIKQSLYLMLNEKEKHFIVSPIDGVIESKLVSVGETIALKDKVAILHGLDSMKVVFNLDESEHALFTEESYAEIYIPAINENIILENFKKSKVIQEKNHSFYVEFIIPTKNSNIIPGLFANVRVILNEKEPVIKIPNSALYLENSNYYVFVVKNNFVKKTKVEPSDSSKGLTDIVKGLEVKDLVVVSEKNKLRDGTSILIDNT